MKKPIFLVAALFMTATALTGCNNQGGNQNNSLLATEEAMDFYAGNYIKLGQYKNLEVNYIIPAEVTQDDVDAYISDQIDFYTEYTDVDRAAKDGDCVCIDFTGTIDGEEFDGGSAEDYNLTLGSGDFLPEFEDALIGKKAGDTAVFTVTFPKDYDLDETVAGKEAEFTVTVYSVSEVNVPEFNDEFVSRISDCSTTAEYEEYARNVITENSANSSADMAGEDALLQAVTNAGISDYPQDLFDSFYAETYSDYQSYAEFMGMDFDDFLAENMSEDDIKEVAMDSMKEFMVVQAIADKEGIKIDEKNLDTEASDLAEEYEYDSVDELKQDLGISYIYRTVLREKVKDFLYQAAKVTKVTEDEYYQMDTEAVG